MRFYLKSDVSDSELGQFNQKAFSLRTDDLTGEKYIEYRGGIDYTLDTELFDIHPKLREMSSAVSVVENFFGSSLDTGVYREEGCVAVVTEQRIPIAGKLERVLRVSAKGDSYQKVQRILLRLRAKEIKPSTPWS